MMKALVTAVSMALFLTSGIALANPDNDNSNDSSTNQSESSSDSQLGEQQDVDCTAVSDRTETMSDNDKAWYNYDPE